MSYCFLCSSARDHTTSTLCNPKVAAISAIATVFFLTLSSPVKCTSGYAIANGSRGIHPPVHTSITSFHFTNFQLSTLRTSRESRTCFTKIPSASRIAERFSSLFLLKNTSTNGSRLLLSIIIEFRTKIVLTTQ